MKNMIKLFTTRLFKILNFRLLQQPSLDCRVHGKKKGINVRVLDYDKTSSGKVWNMILCKERLETQDFAWKVTDGVTS